MQFKPPPPPKTIAEGGTYAGDLAGQVPSLVDIAATLRPPPKTLAPEELREELIVNSGLGGYSPPTPAYGQAVSQAPPSIAPSHQLPATFADSINAWLADVKGEAAADLAARRANSNQIRQPGKHAPGTYGMKVPGT